MAMMRLSRMVFSTKKSLDILEFKLIPAAEKTVRTEMIFSTAPGFNNRAVSRWGTLFKETCGDLRISPDHQRSAIDSYQDWLHNGCWTVSSQ